MDTLYSWNAKRAGGRITVTHSCGKIAGIDTIQPEPVDLKHKAIFTGVVATGADGRKYHLYVSAE